MSCDGDNLFPETKSIFLNQSVFSRIKFNKNIKYLQNEKKNNIYIKNIKQTKSIIKLL